MGKAVLLHRSGSIYDDVPEERYHFPNRSYLKAMREAEGDWIVYYEPMGSGARRGGRQAYFAVAHVDRVEPDPRDPSHSYARLSSFQQFDSLVGQRRPDGHHYEAALEKDDGSTNGGLRQRAVRRITDREFGAIVAAGLHEALSEVDRSAGVASLPGLAEDQAVFERPIIEQLLRRPLRDAAFRNLVLRAYDSTCAFTGLRIVNGMGRVEVDAAHIRPVGDNHRGPDSVRNGIALTKTVHWLFDRGIVAVGDDYRILESPGRLPAKLKTMMNTSGAICLPSRQADWPHPEFLGYHRRMFEETYGRFEPLS